MDENQYERYGDYILNRQESLGSGRYGAVWKGYRIIHTKEGQNLEAVAIKESAYDHQNIQEIHTLQILDHPNIIKYIDYKINGNSLFMIMELCEGGTLEDLLMTLPDQHQFIESFVLDYYSQIVKGIAFMYAKNILHRDIKPSNILIKNNQIKIADFGTSKLKKEDQMIRTLVGTPLFASPEILQLFIGDEQCYTEKSDIWSLGLILYLMFNYQKHHENALQRLKESLPWKGKNAKEVLQNINTKPLEFKNKKIPPEIQAILRKMLAIDVEKRMSFTQFLNIKLLQNKPSSKKHQDYLQTPSENKSFGDQSRVILELSSSMEASTIMFGLTNLQQERTCQPEYINKIEVDFQILKLLELKDNQDYEQQEIMDAIMYYQIYIQQIHEIKSLQFHKSEHILEIQFQIQKMLCLLMAAQKYFSIKLSLSNKGNPQINAQNNINFSISKIIQQKQDDVEDVLEMEIRKKYHYLMLNHAEKSDQLQHSIHYLEGVLEKLKNVTNLFEKEKLLTSIIKPNPSLLQTSKEYLKLKLIVLKEDSFYIEKNVERNEIQFIYDVINLLAFDFCWKIKNKEKNKKKHHNFHYFEHYKVNKKNIKIQQIIKRIKKALEVIKL